MGINDEPLQEIPEEAGPELPPETMTSWQAWKNDPNPRTLSHTLKTLQPVIDKAVERHPRFNAAVLGGEAKRLAIGAIKSFNPGESASLSTHVFNHLRPLGRYTQEMSRAVSVPRDAREDYAKLTKAETDFFEEHGRHPTDHDLQDRLGLSNQKLTKLRQLGRYEMAEGKLEAYPDQPANDDQKVGLWTEYVYHDLNNIDKAIMDHRMGRNGREVMDTNALAAKLGIHPTYVNRRAGAIAQKILDGINRSRNRKAI